MRFGKKPKPDIERQLLERLFTFDGNVAFLTLTYDTFSELIDNNFGDERVEKLNSRLISDICSAVEILPRRYRLDVKIVIKDFGEYEREECERIIISNLELYFYSRLRELVHKQALGWSLIGVGALVLVVSYFLRGIGRELLFDLINISGTLFVWEGVNFAFIKRNDEIRPTKKFIKCLRSIVVTGGEETLAGGMADEERPEKSDQQ